MLISIALVPVTAWEIVGLASWPSVISFFPVWDMVIVCPFCFSASAVSLSVLSFWSMVSSCIGVWSSSRFLSVSFWLKLRSILLFSMLISMLSLPLVWRLIFPCLSVGMSFVGICRSWFGLSWGVCVTFCLRRIVCLGLWCRLVWFSFRPFRVLGL